MRKWKEWCRLCGRKNPNKEYYIYLKSESMPQLSFIIQRHFPIYVDVNDGKPTSICDICYNFLNMIRVFNDRCMKIDAMYKELIAHNVCDKTTTNLYRNKYIEDDSFNILNFINNTDNLYSRDSFTIKHIKNESVTIEENCTDPTMIVEAANEQFTNSLPLEIQLNVNDNYAINPEPLIKNDTIRTITTEGTLEYTKCSPSSDDTMDSKHNLVQIKIEPKSDKEPAFRCSQCNKTFATKYSLKAHEKVHLPAELKLIHQCNMCCKKFSSTGILNTHLKTVHYNERAFVCPKCGKAFKQKCALKEHQLTHSEERPFQCTQCLKTFKSQLRLQVHQTQHGEFFAVCEYCHKNFTNSTAYRNHQQEEHSEYVFAQLALSLP